MKYRTLNAHYQQKFGCKVYKLSLDGGFTCPNRDGTVGTGGCIFCSAYGGGEFAESGRTFVISTHIIEEAADIFEEVIMIDKGKIIAKENTQDLLDRAVHVSGKAEEVDAATEGLNTMRTEKMGRSKGVTVLLKEGESVQRNADITVQPVSLQQLFVAMCGKEVG